MKVAFSKLQATGNDFIIIDSMNGEFELLLKTLSLSESEFVKRVCRRRFAVGADGLIVIKPPKNGTSHFSWLFFNSDGSRASMCGNGARCAARFCFEKGIAPRKMRFDTDAGVVEAEVNDDGSVKVSLPDVQRGRFETAEGFKGYFVKVGVPHFVVEVEEEIKSVDVDKLGRKIRFSDKFKPEGTNVNFVKVSSDGIVVRTYERGVEGETMSCGTGSAASAIYALRERGLKSPIKVTLASGEVLKVYTDGTNATLEGKTLWIYDGLLREESIE